MSKQNVTIHVWDEETHEDHVDMQNVVLPKGLVASLLRALADEMDPPKPPQPLPRFYTTYNGIQGAAPAAHMTGDGQKDG